jgi:hypothetical protein
MKRLLSFVILVMAVMISPALQAQNWFKSVSGNGNVTKEVRKVASFDAVKASAGVNVYLFQGNDEKIVVETDENLQECLRVEVDGSTLKCYADCSIRNASKLNVYVNYRNLNSIKASSGADVFGETLLETNHLDVRSESGADVKLEVKAGSVNCNASSGADIVIKGKADYFEGDASSGADINAAELEVKSCKANASSAGDIQITVTEKIDANASSGGDVVYYGRPAVEHTSESSGGDVKRR